MPKPSSLVRVLAVAFVFICIAPLPARAGTAQEYLQTHAESPWAIMALYGLGGSADLSSLREVAGGSAVALEAPILALTAAGEDPRSYPTRNLVDELLAFHTEGQLGDKSLVNDDIFGVLALLSAGVLSSEGAVADAVSFILANQNADGGWPFSAGGTSDTNTTAVALLALAAAGDSSANSAAVGYLRSAQNADGGWPYDPHSPWGTGSDASSDAWVIMALRRIGEDPSSWQASSTPEEHLRSLQHADGYFQYQDGTGEDAFSPVTTAYAALALGGKSLPVRTITPPAPEPEPEPEPTPAPQSGGGGGVVSGALAVGYQNTDPASPSPLLTLGDMASTTAEASVATSTPAATSTEAATSTPEVPEGEVLGEEHYRFESNLGFGSRSAAVVELHRILIEAGLLKIAAPTGWFGPLTRQAVREYQREHDIVQTGFVGPLTRAALNTPQP